MAKKKLPVSKFELVWYLICAVVILWGLTYLVLGVIAKFAGIDGLKSFNNGFKSLFGLDLHFWGAIIMAIGAVAGVIVMLVYAKTYDRAADREQRRSARLAALKKDDKVVAEQQAEVVSDAPIAVPKQEIVDEVPEQELEQAAEAEVKEEAPEAPAEEKAE